MKRQGKKGSRSIDSWNMLQVYPKCKYNDREAVILISINENPTQENRRCTFTCRIYFDKTRQDIVKLDFEVLWQSL